MGRLKAGDWSRTTPLLPQDCRVPRPRSPPNKICPRQASPLTFSSLAASLSFSRLARSSRFSSGSLLRTGFERPPNPLPRSATPCALTQERPGNPQELDPGEATALPCFGKFSGGGACGTKAVAKVQRSSGSTPRIEPILPIPDGSERKAPGGSSAQRGVLLKGNGQAKRERRQFVLAPVKLAGALRQCARCRRDTYANEQN